MIICNLNPLTFHQAMDILGMHTKINGHVALIPIATWLLDGLFVT